MEFFAELANRNVETSVLHDLLTINRLPELCSSIDTVLSIQSPETGEIYCLWGQFQVSREKIKNGVRFALLNCPHALAWTVTVNVQSSSVMLHCTIDKKDEADEFVESIRQFVSNWEDGLMAWLPKNVSPNSICF